MVDIGSTGIDQFARDADRIKPFLEFHAKVCGVSRVLLILPKGRRAAIRKPDRRVISRDKGVG